MDPQGHPRWVLKMKLILIKFMSSRFFTSKDRMEVVVDDLLFILMIGDPPLLWLTRRM
jgi:hypothetical protein